MSHESKQEKETPVEKLDRFTKMVKEMRGAQRRYFDHRGQENLMIAKSMEGDVDRFVREHNSPQMELF